MILNKPLEIPAGWATLRIQFGKPVAFGQVQEQEPHCIFEIVTVSARAQHVEPDSFAIVGVERSISELAASGASFFVSVGFADSNRPSQMFYKTVFTLHSPRQPGVLRMTCQSDQYAAGVAVPRHLTLAEIRQALGELFTLQLP